MKINLIITAIIGAIAIILGAFGAHALKEKLDVDALASYETGVKYLMYHVLVLLFINSFGGFSDGSKNTLSLIFFIGLLFFSGSIFLISLKIVPAKSIWFITPLGGVLLMIGWVFMAIKFFKM